MVPIIYLFIYPLTKINLKSRITFAYIIPLAANIYLLFHIKEKIVINKQSAQFLSQMVNL